ncbi:helix-turn-helix domain-containing protein [Cognatishimia sp. SS12]|uniref:helix-turn-helix domain-containing protein n=1 Tax=Cognatishimia sp. SS12 TaxID=2979465 RepID=UPI00232FE15A|nr:helix-turn-helix domain-containing protein [Cognatishimia sp. SS12]MDC0739691.1 helix-turn-helix domain-containing protein [Cognatishimia sp. SS12]
MTAANQPILTAADLGQVLRQKRKALGLTQESLALQSGVSVPTIIAAEKGKETAQIGIIFALCRDLGISLTAEL